MVARNLDQQLCAKDDALSRDFLCDEYRKVAQVAMLSGEAVFICGAGLTLEQRETILRDWRALAVHDAARGFADWNRFLQSIDEDWRAELLAGNVALLAIDAGIQEFKEALSKERQEFLAELKTKLKKALAGSVTDDSERPSNAYPSPKWVVFLATGEHSFFYRRSRAKAFGECSGTAYFMAEINHVTGQYTIPSLP